MAAGVGKEGLRWMGRGGRGWVLVGWVVQREHGSRRQLRTSSVLAARSPFPAGPPDLDAASASALAFASCMACREPSNVSTLFRSLVWDAGEKTSR
jgi:hypothetical protein